MTEISAVELRDLYRASDSASVNPGHIAKLRAVWEAAQQALLDDWLPGDDQLLVRLSIVVETDGGSLEEAPYDYLVERDPSIEAHTLTPRILEWVDAGVDGTEDMWPDTMHTIGEQLGEIAATHADGEWHESVQMDGVE